MFGLNLIRNALGLLAANLTTLAATVADINVNLRQRAGLDGPEPTDAAALLANDGKAPSVPQDATGGSGTPTADQPAALSGRNGRRKTVAASAV